MAHQPRLGWPASSLAVEETIGAGGGALGTGAGGGGGAPATAIGAGSRMVERRRGGSGSDGAAAAVCGGAAGLSLGCGKLRLVVRPVDDWPFGRGFIERWRDGRSILVAHRREFRARMLRFTFRSAAIVCLKRCFTLAALPVAASTAPAASAPAADFAAFGIFGGDALPRLLLIETDLLGRTGFVILVRDGMLGYSFAGERWGALARLAATSAAAATSAPAPAAAVALAAIARRLAAVLGRRESRRFEHLASVALTLSFHVVVGFCGSVEHVFVGFDHRGQWRLRRRRRSASAASTVCICSPRSTA